MITVDNGDALLQDEVNKSALTDPEYLDEFKQPCELQKERRQLLGASGWRWCVLNHVLVSWE